MVLTKRIILPRINLSFSSAYISRNFSSSSHLTNSNDYTEFRKVVRKNCQEITSSLNDLVMMMSDDLVVLGPNYDIITTATIQLC